MTIAEEFHQRFAGLARAHGRYVVGQANGSAKVAGQASTERSPATVELFERHLAGEYGLGVVPIRDDATCVFAAIDVDVYPLDLKLLARAVEALGLPLVVCRTKSGGAHLYLFMSEPAPAALVRGKMMEWAVAIGHPGVEVFPKQIRLASEKDVGNWINLPYHGGERSTRYAVAPEDGHAMTPREFLDRAARAAVTRAGLAAIELPADERVDELLAGAPPCLQALARRGFPEGGRNNGLFNVGVYLRKRFPDDWAARLDAYNARFMSPPLGHQEVATIAKSIGKKAYGYKCKDQPIAACCNRQICLTREHGVGGGGDDPGVVFGELIKLETDPPTWIWDVDGARIELTTAELMSAPKFVAKCVEVLTKWPAAVSAKAWHKIVCERLEHVEVVGVPEDATREGQMWSHLAYFCTQRALARSMDEILLKKAYTDPEERRAYFCSSHFLEYLQQHRVQIGERDLFRWLRRRGVMHHFKVLKGKGVNCWSVAAFPEQTEPHDVPPVPAAEQPF